MIKNIRDNLISLSDKEYKAFHAPLMPTIDANTILGVRVPKLRAYAKELYKNGDFWAFLRDLPHEYYEENNLHSFIISLMPYPQFKEELGKFLPYVDNWATADGLRPKCIKGNEDDFINSIMKYLDSSEEYAVRIGIGMLLSYYLDDKFKIEYLERVSNIRSERYYVNMMIAWYFATALAKRYDETLPYLVENKLSVWVRNKTIQKAIESYRITEERKEFLRTLKIKERK